MIAILAIIISTLSAYVFIVVLKYEFRFAEKIGLSIVTGLAFLSVISFVIANIIGLTQLSIIYALLVIVITGIFFHLLQKIKLNYNEIIYFPSIDSLKKEKYLLAAVILFFILFTIIFIQQFVTENDGIYAGWIGSFADGAYHLTLIHAFLYGDNFWPQEPVFTGHILRYPFFADFFSSALVQTGMSLKMSIFLPSILLLTSSVILLYSIAYKITKNQLAAFLSIVLSFFSGGLGFTEFINDFTSNGYNLQSIIFPLKEYTHLPEKNIQLINFVSGALVPQRSLIFGLPLVLTVYLLVKRGQEKYEFKYFIFASILIGILPFFHAHGIILFAIILPVIAAIDIVRIRTHPNSKVVKCWLMLALTLSLLLLPQLPIYFSGETNIHFQLGWLTSSGRDNFFKFWAVNTGIFIPLFIIAYCMARATDKIKLATYYLPITMIFIISNLIIFQPYEYTNSKLFYHWYIFTTPLVGLFVASLLRRKSYYTIMGGILFIVLIFSGALDIWRLTNYSKNKILLFDNKSIEIAEFVKGNTEPRSVFLTSSQHNHPVTALAGRRTLIGYKGWLWTFGINYSQRENDVKSIYSGTEASELLLSKYKVDYIVISPSEEAEYIVNNQFFDKNYPLIYKNDSFKIYKIGEK